MNRQTLVFALFCLAGLAAAQDFPIDPPDVVDAAKPPASAETVDGVPPAGIARPELLTPAVELPTPLAILDRLVVPGTRLQLEWRPAGGISNAEIPSPVIVARGAKPGPVLCLVGGIHGDEINGVEIVRRVAHSVDATRLSGTVIGVPIVNVFGYSRGTRYLPDRRDLNRSFPGSRHGCIAARIADAFFRDVVKHCTVLVDFHTGSFDRTNLPQVRADLTNPQVLEFTRGFGATVVLHSAGAKGMLRTAATAAGIPAVTFEAGAPTRLEPVEIAQAVAAIDRLLLKLDMLPAPEADVIEILANPEAKDAPPPPIFLDSRWIRANSAGLLISEVALGQRVLAGQRLGRVIDPVSNVERYILAPVPGRVIGMSQNQAVLPGYAAFNLGTETSEQHAVEEAADAPATEEVAEDSAARPEDLDAELE